MPSNCWVKDCATKWVKSGKGNIFRLPKDNRAQEWIKFAGYDDVTEVQRKYFRICSRHFLQEQIWKFYPRALLTKDAVPSMNGPKKNLVAMSAKCSILHCDAMKTVKWKLHKYPNPSGNQQRFMKWVAASGNSELLNHLPHKVHTYYRVCGWHFDLADVALVRLNREAVPKRNLPKPIHVPLNWVISQHVIPLANTTIDETDVLPEFRGISCPYSLNLHFNESEVCTENASPIEKVPTCDSTPRKNGTTNFDLPKIADAVDKVTSNQNVINSNLNISDILPNSVEEWEVTLDAPPTEITDLTVEITGAEAETNPNNVISENPNAVCTIDTIEERLKDERRSYCLTSENISKICRTCLKEKDVKNMYENTFDNFTFADLLEMCSTIKIDKDDSLTKQLCDDCIIELVRSYMFRQKCQKSEVTLQDFKAELEAVNQRRDAIKKMQVLDHDYEYTNNEVEVHDLLGLMSSDANSTKPKFIKRFYMFKGNINENSLANMNTNLVEINERKATKLLKKSSQKYPKIFICDGKKSDLQVEIANTDLTKENLVDTMEDIENKENNLTQNERTSDAVVSNSNRVQISANSSQTVRTPKYTEAVRRAIKLVLEGRIGEANRLARNPPRRSKVQKEKKPRNRVLKISFPGNCKVCNEAYETKNEYMKHCRETRHFVKSFPCDKCSKSYPSKYSLINHVRIHSNEKPFMCDKCGACFRYATSLNSHIKIHAENKVFACKVCNRSYPTLKDLIRHRKMNHLTQRLYCCEYCGLFLVSQSNLSQHKKRIHLNLRPQKCVVCAKGFYSKGALLRHMQVHNSVQYNCKLCNSFFRVKSRLLLHMKCRHPGIDENVMEQDQIKLMECPHCDEICHNKQSLSIHLGEVHQIPTCNYCDLVFQAEEDLLNHSILHLDLLDKCICRYCGKIFPDWASLSVHVSKHSDRNYSCQICHRKYTQSQKLQVHMLVHTNEAPYSCKYCTKCFLYKGSLVIHERVHTGDRPYICDICGKGSMCSSSLKRHKTTHVQGN